MRRSTRLPLDNLTPYLLEIARSDPSDRQLDWRSIFGNDQPVEVEVGCGKGQFLLTSALNRAEVNFVGIEIARKYQLFTATRIAKRELHNVRVSCTDARALFATRMPAASLQAVHVYFPDPWWKKRHHKRRVFTAEFVAAALRALQTGGRICAATDVESYFHVMRGLIAARSELREQPVAAEVPGGAAESHTNFERKALLQGKTVYRLCAEKV